MGTEFGGNAFTYPSGPIYPNTEWHPHVCDPKLAVRWGTRGQCSTPPDPLMPMTKSPIGASFEDSLKIKSGV